MGQSKKTDEDLFSVSSVDLKHGPDWSAEERSIRDHGSPVCGVDEVGRGPIAGPVVAAAVILDPNHIPDGLADSKKLSKKKLRIANEAIHKAAVAISIAEASVAEIDEINILAASLLAMRRAVAGLPARPCCALVDGNQDPKLEIPTMTLIKGDGRSLSIAAASIVAKIYRDDLMAKLGADYPDYGWDKNAGYGVVHHRQAIDLVGITPHHRRSFEPIRSILDAE